MKKNEKSNGIKEELLQMIKSLSSELRPIPTEFKTEVLVGIKPRVLLFDVYGTLFVSSSGDISITSKNIRTDKLKRLLKKYNIDESAEHLLKRFLDLIRDKHKKAKETLGIDYPEIVVEEIWYELLDFEDQVLIKKFALEYELLMNPVWPMPGLDRLLFFIKRQSVVSGIISNAQFYTPLLFEAFFGYGLEEIGFYSELLFFSYLEGIAKPSMMLFERAREKLERMGFASDEVLYVGNDMLNDVYPASSVGFKTALFAGDRRSLRLRKENPKTKELNPDVIISNLIDLISILSKN